MTPAQADWLRKLRDEGVSRQEDTDATWEDCVRNGWTDITCRDDDFITPAGLAALEAHEKETTP